MERSEVARLQRQIELEYEASKRIFEGFTPTARHEYISKRQENIEACFETLKEQLGPEEAILVLFQAESKIYGNSSSQKTW